MHYLHRSRRRSRQRRQRRIIQHVFDHVVDAQPTRHSALRQGRMRTVGMSLTALTALLLAGCSVGFVGQAAPHTTPTTTRVATATATSTATIGPQPHHTPVAGLLDPAPTNCPSAPPLQTREFAHFGGFSGAVTLHGGGRAWIAGPYYDQLVPTLHLNGQGYTPWPSTKLIWEAGPNVSQPVHVTATELRTGALGYWYFKVREEQAAPELVLDPEAPTATAADYHGSPETGWQEWGAGLLLLSAGCYEVVATWPGGSWRTVVAAGR
jgi:hypothetical protein